MPEGIKRNRNSDFDVGIWRKRVLRIFLDCVLFGLTVLPDACINFRKGMIVPRGKRECKLIIAHGEMNSVFNDLRRS